MKIKVTRVGQGRSFSVVIPKDIVRLLCSRYDIDPEEELEYFMLDYDGEKLILKPWIDHRRKRLPYHSL